MATIFPELVTGYFIKLLSDSSAQPGLRPTELITLTPLVMILLPRAQPPVHFSFPSWSPLAFSPSSDSNCMRMITKSQLIFLTSDSYPLCRSTWPQQGRGSLNLMYSHLLLQTFHTSVVPAASLGTSLNSSPS